MTRQRTVKVVRRLQRELAKTREQLACERTFRVLADMRSQDAWQRYAELYADGAKLVRFTRTTIDGVAGNVERTRYTAHEITPKGADPRGPLAIETEADRAWLSMFSDPLRAHNARRHAQQLAMRALADELFRMLFPT